MTTASSGIVIVGAGQAAASAAARLRKAGYVGPITLLGEESAAPYQRPPLSKAYLLGQMPLERLMLRAPEWWQAQGVAIRTETRVSAIDRAAKTLTLESGEVMGYDKLLLTTGATPRRLPEAIGGHLKGVFTVRNLADVDIMKHAFTEGARLVVVGGGYIGLEAAAVARKLGLEVVVIEAAPRILGRVASAETAAAIRALHQSHGVKILEGTGLTRLVGAETGHVTGVELATGEVLPADLVITGIGVTPNTALAEAAGLNIDNGIATTARARTSDPSIWAAGDCASFPLEGRQMRLESVGNAIDMATIAADDMLDAGQDYIPKPWFWSDQFDAKLQIAGLNIGYDKVVTRQVAGVEGQSFWYYRAGQLIAVDALNDPRAYMIGKRMIEAHQSPSPEALVAAPDLKALVA